MRRLKAACEQAKKELSTAIETTIELDALAKDNDFSYVITRAKFEELSNSLVQKSIPVIEECLKGGDMKTKDIDQIVLVGGTSRIPKVQEMLTKMFEKPLNYKVNPDECVAHGATLLCAQITGAIKN